VLAALVVAAVILLRPEDDGRAAPSSRPPADVRLTDESVQAQSLWSEQAASRSVPRDRRQHRFAAGRARLGGPQRADAPRERADANADSSCTVPARYGAESPAGSPHVCTTRAND
jgi:hypothetical protein